MAKKKCEYCGEYYDEEYEERLDNGFPACPQCVADEKVRIEQKQKNTYNN